jgi:hypothetical protein
VELLNPRPQQEEQRRTITAQAQRQAEELARLLAQKGANTEGERFTSPWQVGGQIAQTLAARNAMGNNAANSFALNSLLAPGGQTEPPSGATTTAAPPAEGSAPAGGNAASNAFAPEVKQAIIEGSKAVGFPPEIMAQFAHFESRGRPGPEADTGSYKGLMQLSKAEMARESNGQGNVYNPKDSTMAAAQIAKRNFHEFSQKYGKEPTAFDLYMMHVNGAAGYESHLSNPDAPAWQNMLNTGEGRAIASGQQHYHGETGPEAATKWAHATVTDNGGRATDTSRQHLQRWSDKWQRIANGDHSAAFDQNQPPGQSSGGVQMAQAAPPGTPPAAGAPSPGQGGMIEHGTFVDPGMLPKRQPPTYTLPQLQALARSGRLEPDQIAKFYAEITAAQQPASHPFAGGQIIFDPKNPSQQVYMPTLQTKPVKVGDIETQQSFWVDSQGRQHVMPSAPGGTAPESASGGGGAASASAPTAAAGGRAPFPGNPTMTDLANYGEDRQVRIAGEKEKATSQAQATTKMFSGIYGGIGGSAENSAKQAQNIALLKEIAPRAFTGAGTDALLTLNRLADRIGVDKKSAAPRELFNSVAMRILADQFAGIQNLSREEGSPGQRIFKPMLDMEEKANITPKDSLEGVMAKLNMIEQAGKQLMEWGDMADDYVAEHGALDPKFMKAFRKKVSERKFENILPKEDASTSVPAGGALAAPEATKSIGGKTYHKRGGDWYPAE